MKHSTVIPFLTVESITPCKFSDKDRAPAWHINGILTVKSPLGIMQPLHTVSIFSTDDPALVQPPLAVGTTKPHPMSDEFGNPTYVATRKPSWPDPETGELRKGGLVLRPVAMEIRELDELTGNLQPEQFFGQAIEESDDAEQ